MEPRNQHLLDFPAKWELVQDNQKNGYIYIYIYYIQQRDVYQKLLKIDAKWYISMEVYLHEKIYTWMLIYGNKDTWRDIYIYISIYLCIYIYTYIYTYIRIHIGRYT